MMVTISAIAGSPQVVLAAAGVIGGLALLVRGVGGYRRATRVESSATSSVRSVAVGEARLAGTVEAAELTLISPLQSTPCVYYRATIDRPDEGAPQAAFHEERAVGFHLRDATGTILVFPRGARWDVPTGYVEEGSDVVGLALRTGPATEAASPTRDEAIARLLTVRAPEPMPVGLAGGRGSYREACVELGDEITLIGMVLPFDQLPDPAASDEDAGASDARLDEGGVSDPVVAMDLAAARTSGALRDSAEDAWGNAAIPGFGIGQPTREPRLDPEARHLPLAPADRTAATSRVFDIAPETLVVASTNDVPLLIAVGSPGQASGRERLQFVVGLLGAVLAIGAAVALALMLGDLGWP